MSDDYFLVTANARGSTFGSRDALAVARKIVASEDLLLRGLTALVSSRWSITVLITLTEKKYRFMELHRRLSGISQRVLTQTLRELERSGLVSRRVLESRPPATEYALSELGHSLLTPLVPLMVWAESNRDKIEQNQQAYDAETLRNESLRNESLGNDEDSQIVE